MRSAVALWGDEDPYADAAVADLTVDGQWSRYYGLSPLYVIMGATGLTPFTSVAASDF
jgi:hypothetical protein